jgi:hypothetical protein
MLTLSPSLLQAQSGYGSIVGTATDPSGSVISGASVTLYNIGTNDKRSTKSDAAGNYRFVSLVPADYRLDVSSIGFKRMTREPITVQVGGEVRIDAVLQIGETTETVEVADTTPLNNSNATEGSNRDHGGEYGKQI